MVQKAIALESLVQRGRSAFYTNLVSLYQESFDAVSELPVVSHGNVSMTLKSIGFKEKFKSIVQAHMGLTLTKVQVEESSFPNLACVIQRSIATNKSITNLEATMGTIAEKINCLYDDKKGRLDQTYKAKDLPFGFSVLVYTGLWSARNADNTSYFNAAELAAATLHELGHADHFIRTAFRVHGRAMDAADIIAYIQHNPDPEMIQTLITKLKKEIPLDKEFGRILKVVDDYFKKHPSGDDPAYHEALTTLVALVTSGEAAYQLFLYNEWMGGGRDRVSSHIQLVDAERSADEFASRHGAYADLTSMLTKLQRLEGDKSFVIFKQFMWNGPAFVISSMAQFVTLFMMGPEEVTNGYDPLIHRLSLIIETAKHAFHDSNLPDDVKQDLKDQIMQGEAYIRQYKSVRHTQMRASIKKWKDNIVKFGRILATPFDDRLSRDYGHLQDKTRSLTRHPLYYLASST